MFEWAHQAPTATSDGNLAHAVGTCYTYGVEVYFTRHARSLRLYTVPIEEAEAAATHPDAVYAVAFGR